MKKKDNSNIFKVISSIFAEKKVTAVLIGGFAINYYKVTRQTADVDFLITKTDFNKIAKLLEQCGFKKNYEQEVFARFLAARQYLMDVDFMFVDQDTLEQIIQDGNQITIANQKFIVPSINNLIALKLHAIKFNQKLREYHDLPDIIELVKRNKIDVKSEEFKGLCLKYGTEELYKKILGAA